MVQSPIADSRTKPLSPCPLPSWERVASCGPPASNEPGDGDFFLALRATPHPLAALATSPARGEVNILQMQPRSRDARAPELWQTICNKESVARIEQSEIRQRSRSLDAGPGFRCAQPRLQNVKGSGTPKTRAFRPHPSGCGRALSAARSPVGVPPRHLRQRTNATAQLQKRSSWDAAKRSGVIALPAPACPSPAAWRRPV